MEILAADISGAPKGSVAISLNFKKLRIRGLGSAEVMSISYDPKAHRISMRAKVAAPLRLDGGYTIDGRVLVLPITGSGQCSLQLDDVTADLTLAAHEITKNGQKHLAVDKLSLSFDTSKLHMRFDNLFNGNKELGDTMNTFLNQNWPDILRELKPSIDDTFGAAFQALASRIFAKVPYNNIFLP
ncbi:protein takeout-like [Frankliniella occidentalis]|uniref:Protein takeout-like n=1 Tax=Frankliniella occidentalis TaxID=133901 RepID=A0A6J1SXA8_FRAOC|nr:protein takeout-like [Frankliniella occidentalis]